MKIAVGLLLLVLSSIKGDFPDQRLLNDLFKDYNKNARPLTAGDDIIDVQMSLHLLQLVNFEHSVLTMDVWRMMSWKDERLAWDPTKYDNITETTPHPSEVWTPDIALYNSRPMLLPFRRGGIVYSNDPDCLASWNVQFLLGPPKIKRQQVKNLTKAALSLGQKIKARFGIHSDTCVHSSATFGPSLVNEMHRRSYPVILHSDGLIYFIPHERLFTVCDPTTDDKTGEITCTLNFGSWTLSENHLRLNDTSPSISTSDYVEGKDWHYVSSDIKAVSMKYDCCVEKYITAKYKITFKHKYHDC